MSENAPPARFEVRKSDQWDLSPLYPDPASWEREYQAVESDLEKVGDFKGTLGRSLDDLLAALRHLEAVQLRLERLGEYASLLHAQDESDAAAQAMMGRFMMLATRAEGEWSWMDPEIQAIPENVLRSWMEDSRLAEFSVYLGKLLRFKPHILSEKEERILALQQEATATARDAFSLLTNVDLDFGTVDTPDGPVGLSQTSFSWFLQHADRSVRERAYKAFYAKFEEHKQTLAALYSGSVKLDRYLATVRNFPSSRARALFPDAVDEAVYDTLVSTINENLPVLHRYYALKARVHKLDGLRHWDVYAPLVGGVKTDYPYDRAVDTVCAALAPLGSEYVDTLRTGLLGGWVDRYENKGKRSGAFSSGSWRKPPYILLNYQRGVLRDLYTMAHEGGHSMHSWYSGASNPFMCWSYTIFEAEVASTFNEELLFRHLYAHADDQSLKAYLLNARVDNVVATLFRQTMFAEYEARTHRLLEGGTPLTLELLRAEYRKLMEKYFGPLMTLEPESDMEGLRIPHFYRAFYVYKYATGISAAMSLAERVASGGQGERDDYFAFLRSGGSRFPLESLKLAGVDMSRPEPIQAACDIFARDLDELERLLSG